MGNVLSDAGAHRPDSNVGMSPAHMRRVSVAIWHAFKLPGIGRLLGN